MRTDILTAYTLIYAILALSLLLIAESFSDYYHRQQKNQMLIDEEGKKLFLTIFIWHAIFLGLSVLLKIVSLVLLLTTD